MKTKLETLRQVEGAKLAVHPNDDMLLHWHRQMVAIRLFESKVQELYLQGLVPGTTHLCQGQEAVSVGAVAALADGDYLTVTYRGHGHALARGVEPEAAFAELMGRRTGICKGLGGSMHLADASRGLLGAFAIVGAGLPVALGAAMGAMLRGERSVAMTFFGDGATNIGAFHESLNMAAVWKAPVIFVIENNLYGEFSPIRQTTPLDDLADRASAYGIPGTVVDGMDVLDVHRCAEAAVERARSGDGPTLLEMKTYRFVGHSRSDPARYRPVGELDLWKARDPIPGFEVTLIEQGLLTTDTAERVHADVQKELDLAADRAAAADYPAMADVLANVYAD